MERQNDKPIRRPHPQNADGAFYVQRHECMACGAPELQAPTLMSHDASGSCFFARQPTTADEINQAILATWASCCGAVRYAGRDREILVRLAEDDLAESCDHRLTDEPRPLNRNCARFEFLSSETVKAELSESRLIMEFFASALKKPETDWDRILDFRHSGGSSSFRYQWGTKNDIYHADLALERVGLAGWLLTIQREDKHSATGIAVVLHKALEHDARFQRVRWFANTGQVTVSGGRARPY